MKFLFSNHKGMTLIEVTIAGAMMALLGLASMKLAENNAKTQKKMNFSNQIASLKIQSNINLRQGDSCLKTLSNASGTTGQFTYDIGSSGIDAPDAENCKTQGKPVDQFFDKRGNAFIEKNKIYGKNTGASYKVTDLRIALPNQVTGSAVAVACAQIELQGSMVYGQKKQWVTEIFTLNGNDTSGQNVVDNCSAESVANVEDSCKALNGELNLTTLTCEGIDIGYPSAGIQKGFPSVPAASFDGKFITNAAINALGNMGVAENLHVCGDIIIGDSSSPTFPGADITNCGAQALYADQVIASTIVGENVMITNLSVMSNLNTAGNIGALNFYAGGDLSVAGNSLMTGNTQIDGSLKVTKAIETDNSIVATNAQIGGIAIGKSPSSQFLTINSKLKTFNENSVLDDVVTKSWIKEYLISEWDEDKINNFLNTLFNEIINKDNWTGDKTIETIKDFTQSKLTLKNMKDSGSDILANLNGSGIASSGLVAGTDYCPPGFNVVHVEVDPDTSLDSDVQTGELPATLKYYCRPEGAIGEDGKISLRAISGGMLFNSWHLSSIGNTLPCRDYNTTDKILQYGEYCWAPRINYGYTYLELNPSGGTPDPDAIHLWPVNFLTGDIPSGYTMQTNVLLPQFAKYKKDGYQSGSGLGYMTTACVKMKISNLAIMLSTPWSWYQCNLGQNGLVTTSTGCCSGGASASPQSWSDFESYMGDYDAGILVTIFQRVK